MDDTGDTFITEQQMNGQIILLEILAAEFLLEEFGEVLLANRILEKFLQAERPTADSFRLDFFPASSSSSSPTTTTTITINVQLEVVG